jgi:hypothetical protein
MPIDPFEFRPVRPNKLAYLSREYDAAAGRDIPVPPNVNPQAIDTLRPRS